MHTLLSGRVRFGAFELDLSTGELRSIEAADPNNKVILREQVFQILRMLLEREGKIVTREEIKGRLWADDTVVDFDHSINATIRTLRRALGDSADDPRYIETLARRGYRLMLPIQYLEAAPETASEKDLEQGEQSAVETSQNAGRIQRQAQPLLGLRKWFAVSALLAVIAAGFWLYWSYRHQVTLSATDTVVQGRIKNETSDPIFDSALNAAVTYAIQQTPYMNALGWDKVLKALAQLKLPTTTKLTLEVARQVCLSTNSKLVITGSIADAGNGFRIGLDAVDCQSGRTVAGIRKEVADRNQVVHALGLAAAQLRRKLGEPEASLARFNTPLEEELSSSVDALQAVTLGSKRFGLGDTEGAIPYYKHALDLDPNFAEAYRLLASAYRNKGQWDFGRVGWYKGLRNAGPDERNMPLTNGVRLLCLGHGRARKGAFRALAVGADLSQKLCAPQPPG
jgi:DNA-binding winged helix-turn-helix (wHTH) protein